MNTIGLHIAQSLRKKTEVTLPGIGILSRAYTSATYDPDLGVFYPPNLGLHFIASDATADALGFEPFAEAWHTLRNTLQVDGEVHIDGIGTLYQKDGQCSFRPLQDSFFPYKPIPERKDILSTAAHSDTVTATTVLDTVETADVSPDEIAAPSAKSNRWVWWLSAALLLVIAGGGYYYYQNQSLIGATLPTHSVADDTLEANNEPALTASVGDSSTLQTAADTVASAGVDTTATAKPSVPEGNFEVIIASFLKLEEAERYTKTMNAKGYSLRVLHPNRQGNRFKVSYGAYTSPQEADKVLKQVRKELVAGAWVYERPVNQP